MALTHDQTQAEPTDGQPRYEIYVREKAVLNLQHQRAYSALKLDAPAEDTAAEAEDNGKKKGAREGKRKGTASDVERARAWMCQNFFDVRTFGAVMSTGINCGQVRGPVQLTFARSVHPIVALEHSITRMAVATEAEAEKQQGDNRTMGRKHTVPYGLYRAHGFVSAFLARQTGFSQDDLGILFKALEDMFEHDRSAARGEMTTRGLYVFEHASELGNAHAHALFDLVKVELRPGVELPRGYSDYTVSIDEGALPSGVKLMRRTA